ncbi:alkaline phosphatase-like protein [Terfezia boudieri ATCC MYA-4762]|uniref:alkaline phosphatase n=1 Tax=Terfezia boudieri ATCC MYA-4762 TaxID=1051890 RepID=A0A3N4M3G6_9PEZI|nr:alkaline phosphatase-like protein [Terfezia boudieri ATCC MYA-4762]
MARDYIHFTNNATQKLPADNLLIGSIRTMASDSYVTDSAASASAYSCGLKTYNGAIGVDDDVMPCGTVLEAAKDQGFKTGLVVTSRITHATPASYVAHIWDRDEEAEIALQEIGYTHPFGPQVDILMGGGRCFFMPQSSEGSCRKDNINVLKIAKSYGYSVFSDKEGFKKKHKLPYLGLFTLDHMSYSIDRDPKKEPSLTEMALKALDDLYAATKYSEKGFFIMIEASRIDHAGHANDATGHLHDILEYNNAILAITKWIDKHTDSPTLMISTADHECGGLTVGDNYMWLPDALTKSKSSSEAVAVTWSSYTGPNPDSFLQSLFNKYGVLTPTSTQLAAAKAAKADPKVSNFVFSKALAELLLVNFATLGHTAADVSLLGYGVGYEQFRGHHDNTEVAGFVTRTLNLDLAKITKRLAKEKKWIEQRVKAKEGTKIKRGGREHLAHHH